VAVQTEQVNCPSCGRSMDKKSIYRTDPCEVCGDFVCYDCIRRKQVLPPNWELPAGTFRYRCKRHLGSFLGFGWQKMKRPGTLATS
jgi:hypothetical protein